MSNFSVYKASAGSGKTFTLVKEYLKIALADKAPIPFKYKQILAVTFTNKAAAEMKERIINTLKAFSSDDKSNGGYNVMRQVLMQELLLSETELKLRSENVLSGILHNYSDFAIGTIDSFVYRIVRTFAHDLNLPLNFDVELEDENLLSQAISLLLSKVGNDDKLTNALIDFVEMRTDAGMKSDIQDELFDFAKNLLKEGGKENVEKLKNVSLDLFFSIRNDLFKEIAVFENNVINHAQGALEIISKTNVNDIAFAYNAQIKSYFKKIVNKNFNDLLPKTGRVYDMVFENSKWYSGKASADDKEKIESVKHELTKHFMLIYEYAQKKLSEYLALKEISKHIYSLAVLNELAKIIEEYKSENGVMHISEFSSLISKITLEQPVPFIYERIGEKYNHYLLDEFQDTSVLQWYNLLPLVENALSKGNFNMIVGDGKQAIYRFRGGEVELFAQLPKIIGSATNVLLQEKEMLLTQTYKEEHLTYNRRSKCEVVQFNNNFFRHITNKFLDDNYKLIYNSLEQKFDENNSGGGVTIDFVVPDDEKSKEELTCKRVIELVNNAIAHGYKYSDIAVITRNKDKGTILAQALISNGISVVSSESLLVASSNEVNFAFSLIKAILDGGDYVSVASAINWLVEKKKVSYNSFASAYNYFSFSCSKDIFRFLKSEGIEINRWSISLLPVYEVFSTICEKFDLLKYSPLHIQFLLDEILSFAKSKNGSLADLLIWWETKKAKISVVMPENIDAVKIMTIHKSKGLEFPIVILPFAEWKKDKTSDIIWLNTSGEIDNLESAIVSPNKILTETKYAAEYKLEIEKTTLDNLNLLYVATTRAVNHLHIVLADANSNAYVSDWVIDFLKSLGIYSEDKFFYLFGNAISTFKQTIGHLQTTILNPVTPTDWRNKIRLKSNSKFVSDNEQRLKGVIMHDLLSRVSTINDLEVALNNMLSEGLIAESEKKLLGETVHALLANKNIAVFFQSTSNMKNEQDILLADGTVVRPDRIIFENNKTIIVDFKTGKPNAKYHEQVLKYKTALSQMNFNNIESYIVYTEAAEVEKVD